MFSFKKIYKNKIWIYICVFFAILSAGYLLNQKGYAIKSEKFLAQSIERLPYNFLDFKIRYKETKDPELKKEMGVYIEKSDAFLDHLNIAYGYLFANEEENYYGEMDKAYSLFVELKDIEKSLLKKFDSEYSIATFSDEKGEVADFMNLYNYHKEHHINTHPTRETFLSLFERSWEFIFSPLFLLLMLFVAIFVTELKQLDFKVDDASYDFPKENLMESLKVFFIPSIMILSSALGCGIISIYRKTPFGSIRELLTYNVLKGSSFSMTNPDVNWGIYHNSYIVIFLQLLLTTTLCFLVMYLIYKFVRKFLNFGFSFCITFFIAFLIIFLSRRFINIEFYFSFDSIKILSRIMNLVLLVSFAMFFFYLNYLFRFNREPKFNRSRYYDSKNIKGLKSFEVVKLKRSQILKFVSVFVIISCVVISFSFSKSSKKLKEKSLTNLGLLISSQEMIMEEFKDIPEDQMLNNPKKTLELLNNLKESYLEKDKNPSRYLENYLKYYLEGDTVQLGNDSNTDAFDNYNIDRIRYFLENKIKPDDEFGTNGDMANLYAQKDPLNLYLLNMHYGNFEARGFVGEFIKANRIGFIALSLLIINSIISLKICDDFKKNKPALLFTSGTSKRNIYISKFVTSISISFIMILLIYALLFILGFVKGGIGEPLYPVINYSPVKGTETFIGTNVAAVSMIPKVILSSLLFSLTMTSFIFMVSSTGYKSSNVIGVVLAITGVFIASKGFLGKFALINPFTYFDPMLFASGGMNFINTTSSINFLFGSIVMAVESILFFVIGESIFTRRSLWLK